MSSKKDELFDWLEQRFSIGEADKSYLAQLIHDICLESSASKANYLGKVFLEHEGKAWFVNISDILFFESVGNKTKVFIEGGSAIVPRSLSKIEKNIGNHQFFRANRSQLINLHMIEKVDTYGDSGIEITMTGGYIVIPSRRACVKFMELIAWGRTR